MQISHFGSLLPDGDLLPDGALLPDAAAVASSRALSAESPAERQLLRTDFRFAPSLPQRCACGRPLILCCTGPRTLRCTWVSDSALHRRLGLCAALVPLTLCCTGSLTLRCTGSLTLRCTGAPAGNTSWAPQALRCTGAPCRQHLMGASSSALYLRPLQATNLIWRRKVLRFG